MGTRTLVHIKEDKKTIVTIYRQFDGYPSGMGDDIKEILNDGRSQILNGFGTACKTPNQFNGMGCLAAYLIGELKDGKIGNVYIFPTNSKDVGEDYSYTISLDGKNRLKMKVIDNYAKKTIFDGLLKDFNGEEVERLQNQEGA